MERYLFSYIIPVLTVMALLVVFARFYKGGAGFVRALWICAGFLLGWLSAFGSLLMFGYIKP